MKRALRIARRSPGPLLPGLVLDVLRGARLALRLEPFERRPRFCRARLNITRRPLPRGLPAAGRRVALRSEPFERRPRLCRARLNITRRPLPRGLPAAARRPRIARKLLLKRSQTLGDRGFDLDQFFARPARLPARAGANLLAVDGDLIKGDHPLD